MRSTYWYCLKMSAKIRETIRRKQFAVGRVEFCPCGIFRCVDTTNWLITSAGDKRNFVKNAVNWALRQIGKRNPALRKKALQTATEILIKYPDSAAATWIANDALKELKK